MAQGETYRDADIKTKDDFEVYQNCGQCEILKPHQYCSLKYV